MKGDASSGITMNMDDPIRMFTPVFIIMFSSITSLVTRAMISPTGCISW